VNVAVRTEMGGVPTARRGGGAVLRDDSDAELISIPELETARQLLLSEG
jgi:hypothetical protein